MWADKGLRKWARVGIIVLAREACGFSIVAQRRAHLAVPICGNAHANAGATNQDATLDPATCNFMRQLVGIIGIIDRVFAIRAKIQNLQPSGAKGLGQSRF